MPTRGWGSGTFPRREAPWGHGELGGRCPRGGSWLPLGSPAQPRLDKRVVVRLPSQVLKFIKTCPLPARVNAMGEAGKIPPLHKKKKKALAHSSPLF